ncbi:galactose oxidase [Pedobacter sp. LMG 31464]|uniref:Galactose oxidase n=1 Tax=Pedobacter planticolens TaxID=2679964 RepID=A0A923DVW7_9SPHI|nr:kelch repeat-containing protein [Pedobacter planticolens]MBB2144919.1 galactose oxidase [Pedobacter planticolens]
MHKSILLFLLLFMFTTLNKSVVQAQETAQFKWSKLSPIPNKIGFAGSFAGVANGALIVAGGANFPDGGAPWTGSVKAWSNQIFVLEQLNAQWKTVGELPQALGYGASINYKNALIILGGSNEKGHYADVLMLNYKNGAIEISKLPNLPHPIANTCAVLLGDVIYVIGGIENPDSKTASQNFWSLDLAAKNKEWKTLQTWPGVARMLSVAGAQNGSIYLFSGVELINGNRRYLKDAYQYSPKTGWAKIADLPNAVAAAPTPAYAYGKNHLMVFGGDDGTDAPNAATLKEQHPGFSNQILSYHTSTNSWVKAGKVITEKKNDAISNPNQSTWAPVTTTLTVWHGNVILPSGEVRPATRTPNVLMATPHQSIK